MAKRPKGYVEWIHPDPPSESGYMIHSRMYKFRENPSFNGRRIELIAATNMAKTCRFHHKFIREVDLLDPTFTEEIRWSWVRQNRAQVRAFLDMLGPEQEEVVDVSEDTEDDEDGEADGEGEVTKAEPEDE